MRSVSANVLLKVVISNGNFLCYIIIVNDNIIHIDSQMNMDRVLLKEIVIEQNKRKKLKEVISF